MRTVPTRNRALKAGFAAAALVFSLSSCAPTHELKKLSIVQGVGLDAAGEGKLAMTFQIFNSQNGSQQKGNKSGGNSEPLLARGQGASAFDAIRNATLQVENRLYFANTEIYLLGESLCDGGIGGLVDFFERPTDIRPVTHIAVVRGGTAESVLTATGQGEIVPADRISSMLDNSEVSGKIWRYDLRDLYKDENDGMTDLALPAVSIGGSMDGLGVCAAGTAVFRQNKLAGYLDDSGTRGLMWVAGRAKSAMLAVRPSADSTVTLEVTKAASAMEPVEIGGRTGVGVTIEISSNIDEIALKSEDVKREDFVRTLERLAEETVRGEAVSAVETALHGWGADIFGFGRELYHHAPEAWRGIAPRWHSYLRTMPVRVTVKATVNQTAMITN